MIIFKGKTHIAIASTLYFLTNPSDLVNLAGVIIGSILPDIDTLYSLLGKFNILAYSGMMKHRGFTHTIVGMIFFTILTHWIFSNITTGFLFGYVIHLIMDSLTPIGIMWLYPFKRDYYSLFGKKKNPL